MTDQTNAVPISKTLFSFPLNHKEYSSAFFGGITAEMNSVFILGILIFNLIIKNSNKVALVLISPII